MDADRSPKPKSLNRVIALGVAGALSLVLAIVFRRPLFDGVQSFQGWVQGAGALGYVAFVGVYIAATVAFVPCSLLTIAAGVLFGVVKGTIAVSIGSTIGATCAYLLSRSWMRETVENRIAGSKTFSAIDRAIGDSGGRIVFLIRLSPLFPYNLLNYALGLTRVRLGPFILASWAGMLPGTLAYVYLGSLLGSLDEFLSKDRQKSPLETAFYVAGLVATFAVSIVIARAAKKALDRQVES
jgi:uncharacterized membrane protein YdjX (TVP38/TMEM64 family)